MLPAHAVFYTGTDADVPFVPEVAEDGQNTTRQRDHSQPVDGTC